MTLPAILAAAHRAAAAVHGVACTYTRGAASVELTALRGQTRFEAEDEEGVVTQFVSADFLVLAADLALNGAETAPMKGDRILCDDKTYEVLRLGGEQCFAADPTGTRLRIHTKQVAE